MVHVAIYKRIMLLLFAFRNYLTLALNTEDHAVWLKSGQAAMSMSDESFEQETPA